MATAEEYIKVFKKGTIVEVSSEDEGLRGSWYTATVLRTISKKTNKLLVEYHNLMAEDDPSKPLREFVNAILVRPIPPRDPPSRKYRLMEDVDAFHNDGWWEGVVTKVLESSSEASRRYAVFFRCSREQIDFSTSDLRLHREWVRGDIWVSPLDLSLSPRKKRKHGGRGEERENGTCSADRNGVTSPSKKRNGKSSNGEALDVGKRSRNVSSKPVTPAKNGNGREVRRVSNNSGNKVATMRKRQKIGSKNVSNGTSNKLGVKRNGNLKEPRRS